MKRGKPVFLVSRVPWEGSDLLISQTDICNQDGEKNELATSGGYAGWWVQRSLKILHQPNLER